MTASRHRAFLKKKVSPLDRRYPKKPLSGNQQTKSQTTTKLTENNTILAARMIEIS